MGAAAQEAQVEVEDRTRSLQVEGATASDGIDCHHSPDSVEDEDEKRSALEGVGMSSGQMRPQARYGGVRKRREEEGWGLEVLDLHICCSERVCDSLEVEVD
jgi:hypothetical protein